MQNAQVSVTIETVGADRWPREAIGTDCDVFYSLLRSGEE